MKKKHEGVRKGEENKRTRKERRNYKMEIKGKEGNKRKW